MRYVRPKTITLLRFNGQIMPFSLIHSVYSLFFVFILTSLFGTIFLMFLGVDFQDASAAVMASLSNIGFQLGASGSDLAFGTYSSLAKLFLTANMIIGRIEIIAFFALFSSAFYKV